ncbi:hypothetical protein [Streptomyces olivochromogenes]|uniref:hypothetical protein n=1 Tax=Streptomyces olivochromogenes TaxID=1963 RepID=UPI003683E15C
MELVHPLDGLDSRPWSSFSHAYGSAEGLPDLLRALADSDAGAAAEALSALHGSVLHQGRSMPPVRKWRRSWPGSRWPAAGWRTC